MKKVVIVSACRTAIGAFGGTLKDVPAAELGALVVKEAVSRAGIKPEQVDEVIFGNVLQAGLGQNVARQVTLKAGLPIETTAVTINIVCGSGLKSVAMAANQILAGESPLRSHLSEHLLLQMELFRISAYSLSCVKSISVTSTSSSGFGTYCGFNSISGRNQFFGSASDRYR